MISNSSIKSFSTCLSCKSECVLRHGKGLNATQRLVATKSRISSMRNGCLESLPLRPAIHYEPLDHKNYDGNVSQSRRNKCVHFNEEKTVIEIPNRFSYDKSSRKLLWASFKEIRTNARRNREEYDADGNDWRKCKEEDEMVFQRGKLIHPTTFRRHVIQSPRKTQRRVIRASRVLTKKSLRQLLAIQVNRQSLE